MIPTERVVVVVVVVIASRPHASRPSRSRRALDRRPTTTIDDRSNRIDRVAAARSVGRSIDRCSRRRKINRRVVDRFLYRSTRRRSFRIDVVDRRRGGPTVARRARIRDDDDAPQTADSPTRARDGEEKRQGGDERAERRAGGHADGVGAADDGARARGPLRKTPSRGRRRRLNRERMTDDASDASDRTRRIIRRKTEERMRFGRTRRRTRSRSGSGSMGRVRDARTTRMRARGGDEARE